MMYQMC